MPKEQALNIKDLQQFMVRELDKLSYTEDIQIDRHNLDKEWLDQGTRYVRWGVASVEAAYQRDQIADEIDVVKSEVEEDIRNRPEKHGLEISSKTGAPTEASIKMAVLKHKDVVEVKERFNEAKKLAGLIAVGERAMQMRKTSLERLTDLEISGYNAEPKGNVREEHVTNTNKRKAMTNLKSRINNRKGE
jgi:hypothetical protein